MKIGRKSILAVAVVSLMAIGLAACGSSSNSSTTSASNNSATVASAAGGATVSTMSINGVGTVLVDSKGDALYTNNMDSASKVACTGSCTAIWVPLTAPSSGQPTSGDSSVQAKLGVSKSGNQVTYGGKPLYTFVQDSSGQVTGNGVMDSFDGTNFTWTAATVSGQAASGGAATTTSSSSGGGGYGGGY